MDTIKTFASILTLTAALTLITSCGNGSSTGGGDSSTGGGAAAPTGDTGSTLSEGDKSPGSVELTLELPKPEFQGTPKPANLPPGLKHFKGKRPAFFVPEGTTNLSRGKPVTASDGFPIIGEVEQLTDGEKGASDGNFVEFGPGTQWVQVDLEAPQEIRAIIIWHFHAQARVYHDVIVQVANDPDFIEGVTTLYNNDHDNSAGLGIGKEMAYTDTFEGWLVDGRATVGQYVRLFSTGSSSDEMNHYIEVEVWGKTAE
jgi:hypothetical protein